MGAKSAFADFKAEVGRRFNAGEMAEAVELLEGAIDRFPAERYEITYSLAYAHLVLGDHDRALSVLEDGLARGFWFAFPLEAPVIQPMRDHARFRKILATSDDRRRRAQVNTRSRWEVSVPSTYRRGRPVPLFIALHGWGDTIDDLREVWRSERLGREFLTVFVQSSQLVKMDGGCGWDDVERGREEIERFYRQTLETYAADPARTLVGGFSQGGRMAIDVAFGGVIPVSAFVVVNPGGGIPSSLTPGAAEDARRRGMRGVILTGEHDPDLDEQREMLAVLDRVGFACRSVVIRELGHWYPEDFPAQLDLALDFVLR